MALVTAWSGSGELLRSYGFGGPSTKSSFDPAGRPTQITAPDLTSTVYAYEPMSTTVTDAAGRPTRTLLDVWGRTAQVTPPLGPGVSYSYDVQDRLVGATRGGATTTLIYDLAGRKTDLLDPDMGAWRYGYYPSGSLSWQVDARNCQTTLSYDAGDRLTGKSYAGTCSGAQPVTYNYDSALAGYGIGRRTSRQDASGTASWGYDARGQTVTETLVVTGGLGTFTTAWGYNAAGLLKRQTYPLDNAGHSGEVVSYSYNAQMALEAVSGQDQSSHTYLASASYDPAGRILERRLGAGGNLSVRYSYYPWTQQGGRLQQLAAGPLANPSALLDLRYTYNVNTGNLTSIQDYKLGSPQTQTFDYDALDRLTQAGASGGTVGNYGPENYTYSAITGNLANSNGTAYTYGDPVHVHAVTGLSNGDHFGYDSNGNMTSRTVGGQSFALSYDGENRMVGVSWTISGTAHTAAFLYNDGGKRIVSAIDGTTTVFASDGFEWRGNAASSVKYYFAGNVRLAMRTGNAEPLFLLGDHLGSTSVVADGNGQQVGGSPQAYKAWGETRTGNVPTGYRFTGQYSNEADFGLYYYGARWFDPGLKRWASPDTILPMSNQGVQALDRYAYVNNSPVNYVDPDGHCPKPPAELGPTICVALFIAPSTIQAGPLTLHGDNRNFSANSDPAASRGYIWVSPDGKTFNTHMNPSGYIVSAPLVGEVTIWFPPSENNTWTVTTTGSGDVIVQYDLVVSGPLDQSGAAPHLNGTLTFHVNGDGSISYNIDRDGFPWAEAYYYDEHGGVHTIFQNPAVRGNPHDLFSIEPNQNPQSSLVEYLETNILYGPPQSIYQDTFCRLGVPC